MYSRLIKALSLPGGASPRLATPSVAAELPEQQEGFYTQLEGSPSEAHQQAGVFARAPAIAAPQEVYGNSPYQQLEENRPVEEKIASVDSYSCFDENRSGPLGKIGKRLLISGAFIAATGAILAFADSCVFGWCCASTCGCCDNLPPEIPRSGSYADGGISIEQTSMQEGCCCAPDKPGCCDCLSSCQDWGLNPVVLSDGAGHAGPPPPPSDHDHDLCRCDCTSYSHWRVTYYNLTKGSCMPCIESLAPLPIDKKLAVTVQQYEGGPGTIVGHVNHYSCCTSLAVQACVTKTAVGSALCSSPGLALVATGGTLIGIDACLFRRRHAQQPALVAVSRQQENHNENLSPELRVLNMI